MDDNNEQKNTRLTALIERGSEFLTRDNEASSDNDGLLLDRRSYLAAAGLTTAALAGCTDLTSQETVRPVSSFGYGGGPVLQQSSSLTVTESEPNDSEGSENSITAGATVSGTLAVNDSDWYMIDLSATDDVTVEFSRDATAGVTALILYDPEGTFSNLRYVTTEDPVTMAGAVETSGTYFVQVVDVQGSNGGYTLTVDDGTTPSTPTETGTSTPTPTETETGTSTPTPTETATPVEDDYGEQGYGEYGYGGISA